MKIKEGEKIPSSKVFILSQNNPKEIFIEEIIEKDKIIIFGLPGAFTPTCSTKHLPGFINSMDEIKKKNIKKVICISINDPFVMAACGKIHKVEEKIIMLADSEGKFTKNVGAELDLKARGLGIRSKRYAMLLENRIVKKIVEEETAGKCEVTAAENFLNQI